MTNAKTDVKKTTKNAAKDVARAAHEKADETVDKATDAIAEQAEAGAADLRAAAAEVDHSRYARQAAEQVSDTLAHVADAVRNADLASIQEDVSHFARRHPIAFFGGAAALGFLAGRAMKASDRANTDAALDRAEIPGDVADRWGRA